MNKLIRIYKSIKFERIIDFLLYLIIIQIGIFCYVLLVNNDKVELNGILEIVLTVNGLFSAILITYFFSNISWTKSLKLERYKEAELLSQKITNYRRILNKLTQYYNVWINDVKSKSLLEHNDNYKSITYYEFRMSGISDYISQNEENIELLRNDINYSDVYTDAYLAIVSLVHDRKNDRLYYSSNDLYGDFERKGIYTLSFVEEVIEIDHCSMIWNFFDRYDILNFNRISRENQDYIKNCAKKINIKYNNRSVNANLIKEISDDMNEYYFPELHSLLVFLAKGLNKLDNLIYLLILFSLTIGVISPLISLISIDFRFLTEIKCCIITLNICALIYFIINFHSMIVKEIKWI